MSSIVRNTTRVSYGLTAPHIGDRGSILTLYNVTCPNAIERRVVILGELKI